VSSFFLPGAGSVVTIVAAVARCSLTNTGAARGVMGFKTDIRGCCPDLNVAPPSWRLFAGWKPALRPKLGQHPSETTVWSTMPNQS